MLFHYIQTRHGMRQMHAFVTYIFARVWCKAPTHEYSLDLFQGMQKLYLIMEELDREDKAGVVKGAGAFFYKKVNEIFAEFKSLTSGDIKKLRKEFVGNNRIHVLCIGKANPYRYAKQPVTVLEKHIEEFFSKLYGSGFFNLKLVKENIGFDLHDHYKNFAKLNAMPCCPFCGLQSMDTEYDPSREAYDHYLPSSVYPFNSVNFKNLALACHKCNSQYKGAKDPLLGEGGIARKAFYPYDLHAKDIQVSVKFLTEGKMPSEPKDIQVDVECEGYAEEVSTWDSLYEIKKRYIARCCSVPIAKAWINRISIECRNYGRNSEEAFEAELLACIESPWVEASFLKAAYLREARSTGLV
jgi:hypothetical protein